MGRTATTTWTIICDQCGREGPETKTGRGVAPLPEGWVEWGKVLCSEECVVEDARASYRDDTGKTIAA
jgi:hypothetical protein